MGMPPPLQVVVSLRQSQTTHGDSPRPVRAVMIVTNGRYCLNITTLASQQITARNRPRLRQMNFFSSLFWTGNSGRQHLL